MSQSMCARSEIVDHGARLPLEMWTPPVFDQYKQILAQLAEFDRATNQPDCHDPDKAVWMADVEARLAETEAGPRAAPQRNAWF